MEKKKGINTKPQINLNQTMVIPIEIPLYKIKGGFIYGDDLDLIKKWIKAKKRKPYRQLLKYIDKNRREIGGTYDTSTSLIYLKHHDCHIEFLSNLSHEILHFCQDQLSYRGLDLTTETQEAYCYLQGYITRLVLEQMG